MVTNREEFTINTSGQAEQGNRLVLATPDRALAENRRRRDPGDHTAGPRCAHWLHKSVIKNIYY